jgi:hypothetical protein
MKKTLLRLILAVCSGLPLHAGSIIEFIASTYEVAEGGGQAEVVVQRIDDLGTTVTVDYFSRNTSQRATAGLDYVAVSGTLSFGPGEAELTFAVPILNDGLTEIPEMFGLVLTNATGGAELGARKTANVRIRDNDLPVQFQVADVSVAETAGTVTLSVLRQDDGAFPVTIDYTTVDGTALAGADYTAVTGTLTFPAGETNRTLSIPIFNDVDLEPPESFTVQLANLVGAVTLGWTGPAAAA